MGNEIADLLDGLVRGRNDNVIDDWTAIKFLDRVDEDRGSIKNEELLGPIRLHPASGPRSSNDGSDFQRQETTIFSEKPQYGPGVLRVQAAVRGRIAHRAPPRDAQGAFLR